MISKELDNFILDKDLTYWKAELNDGTVVYQDDGRPEYSVNSSWLRLKEYCESNKLFPRKMWIIFRSHTEYCGESDRGFFFSLGVLASPVDQKVVHRYVCGPIVGDKIKVKAWRVPEVLPMEEEERDIIGNEEKTICSSLLSTDTTAQSITT